MSGLPVAIQLTQVAVSLSNRFTKRSHRAIVQSKNAASLQYDWGGIAFACHCVE